MEEHSCLDTAYSLAFNQAPNAAPLRAKSGVCQPACHPSHAADQQ